ncbi:1-acyl-sn-glycerol-3-phosphate acyltransferase [Balneolales bacterium ANBcel1]|nr:1-acyl-sn-glycerol-3-phosphate acyltransferase [Balneolales bacterium ANBcel1]
MISPPRYTSFSTETDPIDFEYLQSFNKEVSADIIRHYYRAEFHGFDDIPANGPVILASNHSGNAFPHDSFVLDQLIWEQADFTHDNKIRPLYSPKLAVNWWMRPFGLDNWWRLFGAIDQTYLNFDRILAKGGRVIYYPEGIPGIGKGFNRRYRLQPFQPSFIKLAARYDVPVIPVYGINAEWINPANVTFRWIDSICNRITGVPFIPLPLIFLALVFPFFFYFGFPCQMKFFAGKPISVRERIRKAGRDDPQNPGRRESEILAEEIRQEMQQNLSRLVKDHGKKPYNFRTLYRSMKGIKGRRWLTSPFGWPILFTRHYRDFHDRKTNKKNPGRWLRDWDLIGYYLPFGWLLLTLFRRWRKPPYGNRGLDKKRTVQKEGRYIWSIAREE